MEIKLSLQKNKLIENLIPIILCAGEGTRISDFIHNIPKPLIKIYDNTLLLKTHAKNIIFSNLLFYSLFPLINSFNFIRR